MSALNTINKLTEIEKIEIKVLMLDIYAEALTAGGVDVVKQARMFRKLVREL